MAESSVPNFWNQAWTQVERVEDIVAARIDDANETSDYLRTTAMQTIAALGSVNFDFNPGPIPAPPAIDPNITYELNLPPILPTSFGEITANMPDRPTLEGSPEIPDLTIPEFVSSISSLNIPTAPGWTSPGAPPVRPDDVDIDIPVAPDFALPSLPSLDDINVPDFDGLTIPTFDAQRPEFEGSALPGILQWSEPDYHPVILDEMVAKLRELWNGEHGIPPAVEQAMRERAASAEDTIANREIDSVADEFSLRGFTMPTGMQAARVDRLREDLAVKKLGLNRELTIKFAEWQIENVRFACTQAIAAENVYVNLHLNAAQRMFEAARFQIEAQINIYNAQVSLFNARMNGYQIEAQVFKTMLDAELARIEVFKAEVEAEIARGQINEQRVRVYTAQVQALGTAIEIYKARMQGAEIQSNMVRNRIEAYAADVRAYGERINAEKIRFDAYEAQVRAEASKAGIIDAEARAYAALIQGKSAISDISVKRAELVIQRNRAAIEAYIADLDAEKARIQSQSSVIQAGAQAYVADTQRFAAVAQAETAKAQLEVSSKEAELRTNISFYQAQVQAYIGNMEQMIRHAALIVDALKAAGQISSTLAAGAMAGVHVGATLSGTGAVSSSAAASETYGWSWSESKNENTNYEGT
jgi:hypothetical protein